LVEALAGLGRTQAAIDGSRRALAHLQRGRGLDPERLGLPRFPPVFDAFRVEWERAAWENAGRPAAEVRAKGELLRWRLHALLAELTGDLVHFHEAALARPDLALSRAALGCALGRAGRAAEAVPHLRRAVEGNPLDAAAARALCQALRDSGDADGAARLAGARRLLRRAAPECVPPEPWFAAADEPPTAGPGPTAVVPAPPGAGQPRVSLCMIVKDEEPNLPACLGSVADLVDEIVVVDTGSTDRTKEVAARFGAKVADFAWVDSFSAARNEGLRHATGVWIFWMDADDRLDADNRAKLRSLFASLKPENAAYSMKCLCLPDAETGTATVVDHVRLFRNDPALRWEHRVHEQILPAIRRLGADVRFSDVVVHHAGYQDRALRQRKLQRDLRLLERERAELGDHPFTLFNLGSVYQEQGRHAEALAVLRRSLERSHPSDSIVRKLYALIVSCHRAQGQLAEAVAACREGRGVYPDDAELLFNEAMLRREQQDLAGAEACLRQLLASKPVAHFASVDAGLRGYKARQNLGVVYREQGRLAEAEAEWRAVATERPDFLPAWLALGELYLAQQRWPELDGAARRLEALPHGRLEGDVMTARGELARRDFAAARQRLERVIGEHPRAVWPRVILSHVLLQEGRDLAAAEQALRDVLALDPHHAEARSNLAVLLQNRQRAAHDAVFAENVALAKRYADTCETPSDIHEHLPTLYRLAKECRHVTEFGTRTGVSTTALLHAQPAKLVCYDRVKFPQVERLQALAGPTEFVFHQQDVLWAEIEETDLLFIDTRHDYDQLAQELKLHAGKARKYIVLHDTTTFAERGETEGHRGLWPAVEEFLMEGAFRLRERYENNNGLAVLERAAP
jgi:tetratricopeptide (TPR) repeat protein